MSKSECRRNDECPNDEGRPLRLVWGFVIGISFVIRHSSFVICSAEPCNACRPAATDGDLIPVIVNGQVTDDFPAAGFFHTKTKPATATLIGRRTVITAAHCIDEGFAHRFEIGGKFYEI